MARKAAAGRYDTLDDPLIAYLAEAFRIEALEQDEQARWDEGERELYATLAATFRIQDQFKGSEGARWAKYSDDGPRRPVATPQRTMDDNPDGASDPRARQWTPERAITD